MAKSNTGKTILIVGAVGLGVYLLANKSIQDKIKAAIEELAGQIPGSGGGGGIGDIQFPAINLPQFTMPGIEIPDLTSGIADLIAGIVPSAGMGNLPNFLDSLNDLLKPQPAQSTTGPQEHATLLDVVYSLPSWAKGGVAVGVTGLGAYGGYQAIRITAPVLRVLGTQAARGIGGAGNILANLLKSTVSRPAATVAARAAAPIVTRAAAGGGLFAGILPGLALSGIMEGAYQIFRTFSGQQIVGMTGVPPLDIINLIRGKIPLGPGATPAPSIFDALFGGLFATAGAAEPAAGGSPATVVPRGSSTYIGSSGSDLDYSWCEAYGQAKPPELAAKTGVTAASTATKATSTSYPAFTPAETQKLIQTFETKTPAGVPAGVKVAQQARYAEAMRNLGY